MPLFDEKAVIAEIKGGKTTRLDLSQVVVRDKKVEDKNTATFSGHESPVYALTVLPDGRLVSESTDNTLKLCDGSGKYLSIFRGHESFITALAVLPDGRLVSGSADGTLKLWDVSGKCLTTF